MISGIYSGASAMDNFSQQQDAISSNLAHLNTAGYRRQIMAFKESVTADSETRPGTRISELVTDFESGVRKMTGRKLDLAIGGDGFFVYQGENGDMYSKNGVVFRDTSGNLVNSDGMALLGDGQPISIPENVSDRDLNISADGEVSANGAVFGTISMIQFDDPQLLNSNSQVNFTIGDAVGSPAENTSIIQGSRELGNAHPVTELVSLMIGSRSFESAQKAIRTISDAIQENIRS